jgi:pimeloyl-ACP methyl ester carboxylesterase
MVFLAGLGNTAHVFDHVAHQFTDRFRVLGLTRRGFGSSSRPASGYDTTTRARDILSVADHFKLNRVVLVGHSIAGDELTKFAAGRSRLTWIVPGLRQRKRSRRESVPA